MGFFGSRRPNVGGHPRTMNCREVEENNTKGIWLPSLLVCRFRCATFAHPHWTDVAGPCHVAFSCTLGWLLELHHVQRRTPGAGPARALCGPRARGLGRGRGWGLALTLGAAHVPGRACQKLSRGPGPLLGPGEGRRPRKKPRQGPARALGPCPRGAQYRTTWRIMPRRHRACRHFCWPP